MPEEFSGPKKQQQKKVYANEIQEGTTLHLAAVSGLGILKDM